MRRIGRMHGRLQTANGKLLRLGLRHEGLSQRTPKVLCSFIRSIRRIRLGPPYLMPEQAMTPSDAGQRLHGMHPRPIGVRFRARPAAKCLSAVRGAHGRSPHQSAQSTRESQMHRSQLPFVPASRSTRRSSFVRRVVPLSAAFVAAVPLAAVAQDKPIATSTVLQRLPAPPRVTVRQTGTGEITLTWGPVEGAKSYVIGRAVGTEGFRRMLDASTGPDTAYVDRRITVGVRHVYTVTPISTADVSGIRATSDSIVPTATGGPSTTTGPTTAPTSTASIVARQTAAADITIQWRSTSDGAYRYYLKPVVDGTTKALVALSDNYVVQRSLAPGRYRYELGREPIIGSTKTTVASSEVVTIGTTSTDAPSTSTTTSGTTVLVPAAPPVALRVGSTLSLGAGQWTSLTPGIASVGADGTVTGRAAGTAQIVAHAVQSDGAVRVTVVRVSVQP